MGLSRRRRWDGARWTAAAARAAPLCLGGRRLGLRATGAPKRVRLLWGGVCCGRSDLERPWRHAVARPAPLHRAESRRRRPGFRLSGRIHLSERRNRTSAASSDPQTLIQVGRPCRDGRVASANLDTGRDSDPGRVTSGSRPHRPATRQTRAGPPATTAEIPSPPRGRPPGQASARGVRGWDSGQPPAPLRFAALQRPSLLLPSQGALREETAQPPQRPGADGRGAACGVRPSRPTVKTGTLPAHSKTRRYGDTRTRP